MEPKLNATAKEGSFSESIPAQNSPEQSNEPRTSDSGAVNLVSERSVRENHVSTNSRRSGSSFLIDNLLGDKNDVIAKSSQFSPPGKSRSSLHPLPRSMTHPYHNLASSSFFNAQSLFPPFPHPLNSSLPYQQYAADLNRIPESSRVIPSQIQAPATSTSAVPPQKGSYKDNDGEKKGDERSLSDSSGNDISNNDNENDTGEEDDDGSVKDAISTRHKKKTRTVFSRAQIFYLETAFEAKRYLSSSERAELAATLHLSETQVKVWFQNRRNKWKSQISGDSKFGEQGPQMLFPPVPFPEGLNRPGFSPMTFSNIYKYPLAYF